MLPCQIRSQCTCAGIAPLLSEKKVTRNSSDTLAKTLASENAAKLNKCLLAFVPIYHTVGSAVTFATLVVTLSQG